MSLLSAGRGPFVSQVRFLWNETSWLPLWHNTCRLHSASPRTLFSSHLLSLFAELWWPYPGDITGGFFEAIVMKDAPARAEDARK